MAEVNPDSLSPQNGTDVLFGHDNASWLNMVEIELSVLSGQCLDQRIPDEHSLRYEIAAWEESRNAQQATVDWRFSVEDARAKLKHLYPDLP